MAQEGKVTVPVKPEPWQEGDLKVPAVLGHDEGQPAYGVAVKTWREGDKLKADLVNIPKEVADAIKAGAYFQTSAEVYDDTGEAGLPAGGGCMLRRIALLGADIPQVKTLADLPKPDDAGSLKGVEIFAVGEHRGIRYGESDLDNMVKNFQRYSAPAVKFSAGQLRHKVTMVRKFASAEQTGPKGGKFHITEGGTKVYDGGGSTTQAKTKPKVDVDALIAKQDAAMAAQHKAKYSPANPGEWSSGGAKVSTGSSSQAKTQQAKGSGDAVTAKAHASWAAARAKKVAENKTGYVLEQAKKQPTIGSSQDHLNALFAKAAMNPKIKASYEKSQAERNKKKIGNAFFTKHDEVTMDRSRIIDALVMAGCDRGVCEAMDDATLQAMAPVAEKLAPGSVPPDDGMQPMADETQQEPEEIIDETQPPAADVSTPTTDEAAPDAPEFDRTAIIAQLVGSGLDANELNALSDDDLKKRLEQINSVEKNADMMGQGDSPDDAMTTPQAAADTPPVQKLACAGAKKMSAKKYAEQQVSALHERLAKTKEEMDKALAQSAKDLKQAKFETFKEKLRASGRLVPAMEEGGLLDDFVQSLDHSTVRKFGEKQKTQFDMLQDILDRLPRVVKYGETVKSSERGVIKLAESKTADEGEEGVRSRYRKFSERFQKMGFKEDEAVEAFKRQKAKNPTLTAEDFLKV